jgi:hypothetical protein
MSPTNARAIGDDLARTGSGEGFIEVVLEFFIGEFSCLVSAPDQVLTGLGLRVEVVHQCPQPPTNLVAHNRIADFSTDRVRHCDGRTFGGVGDETDSKRSTLAPSRRYGK